MGRPSKVWEWKERKGWYATVKGKRRRLGDDRATAERELHRLLGQLPSEAAPPRASGMTVAGVMDRFGDRSASVLVPSTMRVYHRRLADFLAAWGHVRVEDVRPFHVNEWADSKRWADPTKRTAIAIIKAAFAWAAKEGYIDRDPVASVAKPADARREYVPCKTVVEAILAASPNQSFRDFFEAIRDTGCRPGEAAKVTAGDFDAEGATWTLKGKTTRKTRKLRVVYLTPEVVRACSRLAEKHPTGPLYRNFYGDPWTESAYGEAMRRIRKKLGLHPKMVTYAMRHLFVTDALDEGVPIATVAELLGHTSTAMITRNYSHLADRTDHLKDALARVRGGRASGGHASARSDPSEGQGAESSPSPSAPAEPSPRRRRGPKP